MAQAKLPSPALQRQQEEARDLFKQRRWDEALAAHQKVLEGLQAEFGPDHEQVGIQSFSVGIAAEEAGRLEVAERALREYVRISEVVYGPDGFSMPQSLEALADLLVKLRRPADAEPLLRRSLAIRSALASVNPGFTASAHTGLGNVALARGDAAAALGSFRTSVGLLTAKRDEQTIARHVQDIVIRQQLAAFTGLVEAAWQMSRRSPAEAPGLREEAFAASQRAWTTTAGAALARMAARLGTADTPLGRRVNRHQRALERVLAAYQRLTREDMRWFEVQKKDAAYSAALEEVRQLSIAQARTPASTVKRQIELGQKMQGLMERCPPGQRKPGCEGADKDRQAIIAELTRFSQGANKNSGQMVEALRRLEKAEARLPGVAEYKAAREATVMEWVKSDEVAVAEKKAIAARYPEYVALIDPEPLSVHAIQALLKADEALVTFLVGKEQSYVWAMTREGVGWARIGADATALGDTVARLRQGLDPLAAQADPASQGRKGQTFDLAGAHALYAQILGPVQSLIASKRHLIVVPTGPLTSLPFQVLMTDAPVIGADPREALRQAPWLVRRHALSVLPSVMSLASLRRAKLPLAAAEPFLGIGNPALQGRPVPAGQARGVPQLASLYRNGKPDLRALRELQPLPETATELKAIAEALSAPIGGLLLGHEATETKVRQTDLTRYRIVHFATHGLVAGELSGLAEPALVLTPPIRSTEADDGLLTASEVATLNLNADWVVLSACNTASGSQDGAEALSGLARAFFFAGSRALLVSHWAVNSDATVWLTTGTFAQLGKTPELGRAEAFRRTMLAMIDAGLPPSAWAPFVIVGEGGRGR